jgi:integrase
MPRKAKSARLYLRRRAGREAIWVILDRGSEVVTRCPERDFEGAERALARYIAAKHQPSKKADRLEGILITDVVNIYARERGPKTANPDFIKHTAGPIGRWWAGKHLSDIRSSTCDAYVRWRVKQGRRGVSEQTARHDLKTLRAAINYFHAEYGPLPAVPVVSMPAKASARTDYWLTRNQVAQRIRAARKLARCGHVERMLVIGAYTGTRPGATLKLRRMPSTTGGWFDLDSETVHRRGSGVRETRKRQPPARIHRRLLRWLRHWQRQDEAWAERKGRKVPIHVVHYYGKRMESLRNAWEAVAGEAGHSLGDGPHIMRHTAATWQMQAGVDPYEAAGYLGMSVETLLEVYGHHSPSFQDRAAAAAGRRAPTNNLGQPKKPVNGFATSANTGPIQYAI